MPSEAEVLVVKVLVDNTSHTHLAMVTLLLRAVVPDWLGVFDDNLEDVGSLAFHGGEVKASEETGAVSERLTRFAKAGLGNGVVGGEEVPFDDVTDLSHDVVGVEAETTETCVDGVGYPSEGDGLVGVGANGLGSRGCKGSRGEERDGEDLGEHFYLLL